jgi:hypothetical protein
MNPAMSQENPYFLELRKSVFRLLTMCSDCIVANVLLILFIASRELSKVGDLLDLDVCMEFLDLLHETEDTSLLFKYNTPCYKT